MTADATLSTSLRILARDIQSDDGVANACIDEAADRIDELCAENTTLRDYVGDGLLRSDYKSAAEMRIEINRLTDEVASLHTEIMAQQEDEADLRNSLRNRDDEIKRQHAEILHLRIYAPGQRQAHEVRMAPHVGPTNWRFFGLEAAEKDFDSFGKLVPNETEL